VVAAADIDLAAAERTAGQAAGNSRRAIAIEADCGDVASIEAMVARAVAELGRLDVIVNNAGVTRYAYIMDLTEADWDRIHRVNAKGVFFCLQRAAREMIKQFDLDGAGGRIINIASISGRGYAGASQRRLCREQGCGDLADQDGSANSSAATTSTSTRFVPASPGRSLARAMPSLAPPSAASPSRSCWPSRRPASRSAAPTPPTTSPQWRLFLASPGSRNITGQSYNVDGGLVPS